MKANSQGSTGLVFEALLVEVTLQWRSWGVGALVGDQWIPHLRAIPDGQLWSGGMRVRSENRMLGWSLDPHPNALHSFLFQSS